MAAVANILMTQLDDSSYRSLLAALRARLVEVDVANIGVDYEAFANDWDEQRYKTLLVQGLRGQDLPQIRDSDRERLLGWLSATDGPSPERRAEQTLYVEMILLSQCARNDSQNVDWNVRELLIDMVDTAHQLGEAFMLATASFLLWMCGCCQPYLLDEFQGAMARLTLTWAASGSERLLAAEAARRRSADLCGRMGIELSTRTFLDFVSMPLLRLLSMAEAAGFRRNEHLAE